MANASEFRTGNLTPEQAETFAALFIPTWEMPAEISAGPDPGFKPAAMDAGLVSALSAAPATIPSVPTPQLTKPVKATMMGMAAPPPQPAPEPAPPAPAAELVGTAPPTPAPPKPVLPSIMIEEPKPEAIAAPAVPKIEPKIQVAPAKAAPLVAAEASDAYPALQKKKSPVLFIGLGAVAVIGAIAFFATRSSEPAKTEPTKGAPVAVEKKGIELPDPPATTAAPPPAETTPPPPAAEAKTADKAAETAAPAVTKEPPPAVKEPPKAAAPAPAPPPPPKAAAPKSAPPPAAKAAPPPAGGKKAPIKIKDEF